MSWTRVFLEWSQKKIEVKRFFDGTDPSLVIKDLAELGNIDSRDAVYIYPEGILPSINLNEIQDYWDYKLYKCWGFLFNAELDPEIFQLWFNIIRVFKY